nr:MAG TPA: hypothetical protein [Caudoviricetes sp.]
MGRQQLSRSTKRPAPLQHRPTSRIGGYPYLWLHRHLILIVFVNDTFAIGWRQLCCSTSVTTGLPWMVLQGTIPLWS